MFKANEASNYYYNWFINEILLLFFLLVFSHAYYIEYNEFNSGMKLIQINFRYFLLLWDSYIALWDKCLHIPFENSSKCFKYTTNRLPEAVIWRQQTIFGFSFVSRVRLDLFPRLYFGTCVLFSALHTSVYLHGTKPKPWSTRQELGLSEGSFRCNPQFSESSSLFTMLDRHGNLCCRPNLLWNRLCSGLEVSRYKTTYYWPIISLENID